MKKLISIVCVVLVVFCMINVFENKPQALFVADDAFIVSVIGSVLLSIALSEGIALATGGESVYTGVANALWDYFLTGEANGDVNEAINKLRLYGSFVYQGGKFYFALNQNGYNFFRSWLMGIDFDNYHLSANVTVNDNEFLSNSNSYLLSDIEDHYAIGSKTGIITLSFGGCVVTYEPTGFVYLTFNDGTILKRSYSPPSDSQLVVITSPNRDGYFGIAPASKSGGYAQSLNQADRVYLTDTGGLQFNLRVNKDSNNYIGYNGNTYTLAWTYSSHLYNIKLDDTVICRYWDFNTYNKKCYIAGSLLTNVSNNDVPVNSDTNLSSANIPVEFEDVAAALPNNTGIGRNQVALIPVPGNTVDAEDESIVLSPGEVKQYDREGKDYTFIPVPGQLQGKTGADLGVAIMNRTTFEETSTPVYTGSVPDVFPTASPDVTITAGADVFPTVAPTEAPTAGEGSTADAIAGDIADIKDEVGDLSTPLTPPQAQTGTNKLKIPQLLLTKFPFCIPYDFYNAINQFNAEAEMPSFDIPFHFAQINFDYTMHIDFERFTTLAKICQWFFSVSWVVILILLTRKVIWK